MFQLRFFHKACYTWDCIRPLWFSNIANLAVYSNGWVNAAVYGWQNRHICCGLRDVRRTFQPYTSLGKQNLEPVKTPEINLELFQQDMYFMCLMRRLPLVVFFIGGTPVARRVDLQLFWMCVFQILQVPVWIGGAQSASSCCFFLLQHGRKALRNEGLHIWKTLSRLEFLG